MSGYFRRLAAHTLGRVPNVHSTARGRIRFRPNVERHAVDDDWAPNEEPSLDRSVPPVTEPARQPPETATEQAEPQPPPVHEAEVVQQRSPDRDRSSDSESPRRSEVASALTHDVLFDPPATIPETDAPTRPMSVRHRASPRNTRSHREAMLEGRARSGAPEIVGTSRETQNVAREHPRTIRQTVSAGRSVPDVHIHIGRVELVATVPARKAQPAAADDKKPMSLDEYFRRRGRRPA